MTDCEIILKILSDGKPHFIREIMDRGKPNCLNWAVRSRISDLILKKKYKITSFTRPETKQEAWYQLSGYPEKSAMARSGYKESPAVKQSKTNNNLFDKENLGRLGLPGVSSKEKQLNLL